MKTAFLGFGMALGLMPLLVLAEEEAAPQPRIHTLDPNMQLGEPVRMEEADQLLMDASKYLLQDPPRYRAAAEMLEKANSLRPDHPATLSNLSAAYFLANKLDQALEFANQAIAIEPRFADPYRNRADIYLAKNKSKEALGEYQKAIDRGMENEKTFYNKAIAHLREDQMSSAIAMLRKALEINPSFGQAHLNLGGLLAIEKQLDEGIKHLLIAKELLPETPNVYLNLMQAYELKKNKPKVLEAACAFLNLDLNAHPLQPNLIQEVRGYVGSNDCHKILNPDKGSDSQ